MSAIDNKHLLEILQVLPAKIAAKGDRKEFTLHKAQCVFHGGEQGVQVGQLILPDSMKDTTAGKYLAEFELAVNYKLEVIPRIIALHPHGASSGPRAAQAQPAAPASK
jgi:hypothetical protein